MYASNSDWNKVAGLYIFASLHNNRWNALYVGQTDDFSSRLPNHERLGEAIRKGATHIHAVGVQQVATRDRLERALIQHLQPPLNTLLRGGAY